MSKSKNPPEPLEAPITINIGNISDGAAVDAFEMELQKVLANIYDLNTPATETRSITLKIKFKPREDRVQIDTTFTCDSSLAGLLPKTGRIFVARDEEGSLYAIKEDPRQIALFQAPPPAEKPKPIEFKAAK